MSKPDHHTELTEDQCQRMNRVQELARQFGELLELERNNGANLRWCAIAATHMEQGSMALKRAIADPPVFG